MKTNAVKLILSISLVLLSIVSFAQRAQLSTPEERATRQTARMKEVLNLSAEQEASVAEINLNYAQQMQTVLETGGRNLRTARTAKSIMKRKNKEMKKVLDKGQYKQYKKIQEEMRSMMKGRLRRRS